MSELDRVSERLARLGEQTAAVGARSDFADRVMRALPPEAEATWLGVIPRSARALVPIAALVSLAALAWAWTSDEAVEDSYAAAYDAVEVDF